MTTAPQALLVAAMSDLRSRVDAELERSLAFAGVELRAIDPAASLLVDEIVRLVSAGGKRVRPAFCYWGFRAAGGSDGEPIIRAASALELLHTMALIHDDLMDDAPLRRGVPSVHTHLESTQPPASSGKPGASRREASSSAIIVGDLAAVLADRLFLDAGFDPSATVAALDRYHQMRVAMAAGQFLDVTGSARGDEAAARRVAALKGGTYTVSGPLAIGATLAGATDPQRAALERFASPLGEAFQLRDDLIDGEGAHGATPGLVNALVDEARSALDPASVGPAALDDEAVTALRGIADLLEMT